MEREIADKLRFPLTADRCWIDNSSCPRAIVAKIYIGAKEFSVPSQRSFSLSVCESCIHRSPRRRVDYAVALADRLGVRAVRSTVPGPPT